MTFPDVSTLRVTGASSTGQHVPRRLGENGACNHNAIILAAGLVQQPAEVREPRVTVIICERYSSFHLCDAVRGEMVVGIIERPSQVSRESSADGRLS